jgi:Mrp family chromosome partitioning ATPase
MGKLLAQIEETYDVAVIDSAPLLPVTDGAILAKLTGGAILVVGAGMAHKADVQEALRALETVGARVHGVVLNRLAEPDSSAYQYRYYDADALQRAEELSAATSGSDIRGAQPLDRAPR